MQERGHKLQDLWKTYKGVCGNEASEIESLVMKHLATDHTFEEMLSNDNNVFEDYRYFFEPRHLEEIKSKPMLPQFLRVLAKELYGYIDKRWQNK